MHKFLSYMANRFYVKKQFSKPLTLRFFVESKMALRCLYIEGYSESTEPIDAICL